MKSSYEVLNGLRLYYEIHGEGHPLVLIHGGGSTIQSNFGIILPYLCAQRMVIAVELQGHGRTADIDRPFTFEQDADDVAALLNRLDIKKADILGFSNGANTAMQLGIRYPGLVKKIVVASGFYKRSGLQPQLFDFLKNATVETMPKPLQDAYLTVNPDHVGLKAMHDKDRDRMYNFKDWPEASLTALKAPVLLICGDRDVIMPEHVVEMYRRIPSARLLIVPGGHGDYLGEVFDTKQPSAMPEIIAKIVLDFTTSFAYTPNNIKLLQSSLQKNSHSNPHQYLAT